MKNGEVFAPEPQGQQDVLLINDRIVRLGETDRHALEALRLNLQVINASGCVVTEAWSDRRPQWMRVSSIPVMWVADRAAHNRATMQATLAALKASAESA